MTQRTPIPETNPSIGAEAGVALPELVHRQLLVGPRAGSPVDGATVTDLVRALDPLLSQVEVDAVVARVLARVEGLGPLQPFLADPDVTDVMVNGDGPVWLERHGCLQRTNLVLDAATVTHLIERIVAPLGLRADRTSPLVDARLPDGSRVNAVVPPLAVDGPCLTIRRFGARAITLDEIAAPPVVELLRWAVSARANVVISGGAGAGKTTVLNALASAIPSGERVVTVEDAAELRLPGAHVVRLEARPSNADGVGAVTIRDLVRNALRMRPDRIVVGEVRGGEALDMLLAMNTGHEGSLSTCHANSADDVVHRLETLALMADVDLPLSAVREQLKAAVDLIVHLARWPDGRRRVVSVAEVVEAGEDPLEGSSPSSRPRRVRTLVQGDAVIALPQRAPRSVAAPPPSSAWLAPAADARPETRRRAL